MDLAVIRPQGLWPVKVRPTGALTYLQGAGTADDGGVGWGMWPHAHGGACLVCWARLRGRAGRRSAAEARRAAAHGAVLELLIVATSPIDCITTGLIWWADGPCAQCQYLGGATARQWGQLNSHFPCKRVSTVADGQVQVGDKFTFWEKPSPTRRRIGSHSSY